ncbi:MAG: hypothetical protein EGS37_00870 [Ruthenibacterium lactatiformans]|nr:hypothetical protein [Ruthenibacterium lactatiformans]
MIKRAILSVSDKTGIVELARRLAAQGVTLLSTGGTMKAIEEAGIPVTGVSDVTGFPECLDGRVKTLHPAIHAGLLAVRDNPEHMKQLEQLGVEPIDMVVINLYPFRATIEKPGVTFDEAIENIDIGGPTMLRAAAKNAQDVVVVIDPADYELVLNELEATGDVSLKTKRYLQYKVFEHTAQYDCMIQQYLRGQLEDAPAFPQNLTVTFENGQARERTQVLMDIANQNGGIVIGTGDLSELALGWCTYNGDHMSMYAVNCSIPKTLVRHLVAYLARDNAEKDEALRDVLEDILDTPVSPELLPAVQGEISQRTEDLVGPYELHDFFLYYAIRWGFPPRKVFRLAEHALGRTYDRATILKWLNNFYRRFFSQQFKRNCLPDGPKVGTVAMSPRGDWRMPSDAVAALWLEELEGLE